MSRLAWPLGALALALLSILVTQGTAARWDWQPSLAGSEPWRAWTGALVHWSRLHLAMNLLALAGLGWLGWRARAGCRAAIAWLVLAWPLTQLGLLLVPGLRHYGGLSGVLHAGVAVLVGQLWCHGARRERAVAAALGAGLLAKLISEAPWQGVTQAVPGWDFALAPGAHLSGAVAGALAALACLRRSPRTGQGPTGRA